MNDVPAPSAQVIVPNAHWTFLLEWKPDYRALTCHTVHSLSNSMLLCLGFPHHLVKGNIYVRQSFLSLKSQVSVASLHVSRHLVPSLLSCSVPGNEFVSSLGSPDINSWHQGPVVKGTWKKKGRACSLNPSPRVWSLWGRLVGVYEPPRPMLLFTMISAFISRQTSACPLLAYNTKLKSLDEE